MENRETEREFNLAETEYKEGKYSEAVTLCSDAITREPGIVKYYIFRAKCLAELNKFSKALNDCDEAFSLDNGFAETYLLKSTILLSCGKFREAMQCIRNAIYDHLPNDALLQQQLEKCEQIEKLYCLAQRYMELKKYEKALVHLETIKDKTTGCRHVDLLRAECQLHLGSHSEAERILEHKTTDHHSDYYVDELYLEAHLRFYQYKMDLANALCHTILKRNTHHRKTIELQEKLRAVESIFRDARERAEQEKLLEARAILNNGISMSSHNKELKRSLYLYRSEIHLKLKAYLDAISDCNSALSIDNSKPDAYIIRAAAYEALNVTGTAASDRDIATRLQNKEGINLLDLTPETVDDYEQIADKLKTNSYPACQILNVRLDATIKDIRTAHSKLVRKYHPDQFAKRPELRPYCEEIFMSIKESCNDLLNKQYEKPESAQ